MMTEKHTAPLEPQHEAAGLGRRFAALLYDAFVLIAVEFVAVAAALAATKGGLEVVATDHQHPLYPLVLLYQMTIAWLYYAWFWTNGGQSPGMKVWRIKVSARQGESIGWIQATRRFFASLISVIPAGLGFLWILIDSERRAWHDRLSDTDVVRMPR